MYNFFTEADRGHRQVYQHVYEQRWSSHQERRNVGKIRRRPIEKAKDYQASAVNGSIASPGMKSFARSA